MNHTLKNKNLGDTLNSFIKKKKNRASDYDFGYQVPVKSFEDSLYRAQQGEK